MANLQESAVWEDGIYQWETEDPVVGGADGIDNVPTRQLANRTKYLLSLFDEVQPLDATLTALAKLTTEADNLIYATGADTFETAKLTSFIRTLLDDANAMAARSTLGAASVDDVNKAGGLKPITAVVLGNNLILTLPKQALSFRSATLSDGSVNTINLATDLTLTVPNGATLGTTSATLANLVPVVLYNAGNPELGIVNLAGGLDLSESGLLSSTAISTSASSTSVVYSSTAVANSPYIVAGLLQSTQATAGVWATTPNVSLKGSNLVSSLSTLGFGVYNDVTASRSLGITYYNTKSKPIFVRVHVTQNSYTTFTMKTTIAGVSKFAATSCTVQYSSGVATFIVPAWASYLVTTDGGSPILYAWEELY